MGFDNSTSILLLPTVLGPTFQQKLIFHMVSDIQSHQRIKSHFQNSNGSWRRIESRKSLHSEFDLLWNHCSCSHFPIFKCLRNNSKNMYSNWEYGTSGRLFNASIVSFWRNNFKSFFSLFRVLITQIILTDMFVNPIRSMWMQYHQSGKFFYFTVTCALEWLSRTCATDLTQIKVELTNKS